MSGQAEHSPLSPPVLGVLGILLFLGFWQLAGANGWGGLTLPALDRVLAEFANPQRQALFLRAAGASLASLGLGLLYGAMLGIGLALMTRILPFLWEGLDNLAALVNAIPSIALAPIFMLMFTPETVPVAIAAMSVYFVTYVATRSALAGTPRAYGDLMGVLGASRWRRLRHVEWPSALPGIATALRLSVPVALVGVVVGEWFGAPRGFGLIMISAMQNFQIPLLWATVLLVAICSLTLYLVFTALEKLIYRRFT